MKQTIIPVVYEFKQSEYIKLNCELRINELLDAARGLPLLLSPSDFCGKYQMRTETSNKNKDNHCIMELLSTPD